MAAAALSLFPEATPARGLSLVDRLDEVETILQTLESLEDSENSESYQQELQEQLIRTITGTREKIDKCGAALSALTAAANTADIEATRQQNRSKRFTARAACLESYLLATMTASQLPKLDGFVVTFAQRKNPHAVTVDDETQIPAAFLRTPPPPPPSPDKTAIKDALKLNPAAVPGCRLTQSIRLVRS